MGTRKTKLKEGSLVQVIREGSWTLCCTLQAGVIYIRECPAKEFEVKTHPKGQYGDIFKNIEGKIGLIVHVARNRLDQPLGYRVLMDGKEMFCKSKIANKYFKLAETEEN